MIIVIICHSFFFFFLNNKSINLLVYNVSENVKNLGWDQQIFWLENETLNWLLK